MEDNNRSNWHNYVALGLCAAAIIGVQCYRSKFDNMISSQPVKEKSLETIVKKEAPVLEQNNSVTYDAVQNFDNDDDTTILARMIFSEARGESYDIMKHVGYVAKNRTDFPRRFGEGIKGVILKPKQFSGFNEGEVNLPKLMNPLAYEKKEVWDTCYRAAQEVLSSEAPFKNAYHFNMGSNAQFPSMETLLTLQCNNGTTFFLQTK